MSDSAVPNQFENYCFSCGAIILKEAEICPKCGVRQSNLRSFEGTPEVYCKSCGEKIKREAEICPKCGVRQFTSNVPDVKTAGPKNELNSDWLILLLLCFFLGGFGIHQFYSGKTGRGIAMAVIFVVSIPLCYVIVGVLGLIGVYIWALVDFINIIMEKFTNANGVIYYRTKQI